MVLTSALLIVLIYRLYIFEFNTKEDYQGKINVSIITHKALPDRKLDEPLRWFDVDGEEGT